MAHLVLSRNARKTLLSLKGTKQVKKLQSALNDIRKSPHRGSGVKSLSGVPNGFRKRVGRYRILYTVHAKKNLIRVWIINMEKDTRKDYGRWMKYILEQL